MTQFNPIVPAVMLLVAGSMPANGAQTEASDFERRAKSLGEKISSDDSHESARCRELRKEVEKLREKGQRGLSAKNRYKQECQALYNTPEKPSGLVKDD